MAVVQHVPELALALVALDDGGLQAAGPADDALDHGQVAGAERRRVALHLGEVVGVEHDPVLDDLGHTRAVLALRQRADDGGIDEHEPRLVEGADQVLGVGVVDRGLAPDGRVHLGEHRGRHLDEVDAAHIGRRDEAHHVAYGAAAEGEHGGGPVETEREQLVPALPGDGEGLGRLALRHLDQRHGEPRPLEAPDDRLAVEGADRRIAHEGRPRTHAELAEVRADRGDRAGLDDDPIRPEAQVHVDDH